jgi:hypothetical protein
MYYKFLLQGKHLASLKKEKKISKAEFERRRKGILMGIEELIYEGQWNDYTYNDENANYTFYYEKNDQRLNIDGAPNYTFLSHDYLRNLMVVDTVHTSYYINNPQLIKNLNFIVVTNAEHFGKIAAFYRYLQAQYPALWEQVYMHYWHTEKIAGETPRFIATSPPNEN